ncbi:MAG TPA: hypothetical protein VGV92_00440 [Gammaproteobacteria bacterium]|nr:hypothetical protein [Gammaproteobacteria bacterium]
MRAFAKELLPRFSLNKPAPALIYIPDVLLLAVKGSGAELERYVSVNREKQQRLVSVVDLKENAESTRLVYLKGLFYAVNKNVPPIVTSENCSANWLGKESEKLYALNSKYHEHFGIVVTLEKGDSFTLRFGEGVCADIDDIYVWRALQQNSQGVDLRKLIETRAAENTVRLRQ